MQSVINQHLLIEFLGKKYSRYYNHSYEKFKHFTVHELLYRSLKLRIEMGISNDENIIHFTVYYINKRIYNEYFDFRSPHFSSEQSRNLAYGMLVNSFKETIKPYLNHEK